MSTRTVTIKADDLTGKESEDVVAVLFSCSLFTVDGKPTNYEIDLNEANRKDLEKFLTKYVVKSRQVGRMRAASFGDGGLNNQIRSWGASQKDETGAPRWPDLASRGRMPKDLIEAYAEAHGSNGSDDGTESVS